MQHILRPPPGTPASVTRLIVASRTRFERVRRGKPAVHPRLVSRRTRAADRGSGAPLPARSERDVIFFRLARTGLLASRNGRRRRRSSFVIRTRIAGSRLERLQRILPASFPGPVGQEPDLAFGRGERRLAVPVKADAALVRADRILQAEVAAFHPFDQGLELGEGRLEALRLRLGIGHVGSTEGDAVQVRPAHLPDQRDSHGFQIRRTISEKKYKSF